MSNPEAIGRLSPLCNVLMCTLDRLTCRKPGAYGHHREKRIEVTPGQSERASHLCDMTRHEASCIRCGGALQEKASSTPPPHCKLF